MRRRLLVLTIAFLGCALPLAGCGSGGGGATTAAAGTALAKGSVVTVDGSTANLDGIEVTDARTGETSTTDANGAFDLGDVPTGELDLCIGAGAPPSAVADLQDGDDVTLHLHVRGREIEGSDSCLHDGDLRAADFRLERSVDSDDPDVTGEGRIVRHPDADLLEVRAHHLDPFREVELFVISPEGAEESQGVATATDGGNAGWRVTRADGGRLPFGADTLENLEGWGLEVRDAGDGLVLLFGTIPPFPVPPVAPGDHGQPPVVCVDKVGVALLPRADGVIGESHVAIESRTGDEPRESFAADVVAQVPGATFTVWLEVPANPGTFDDVGGITVGDEGRGYFLLSTRNGDTLPFGVTSVSALVGLGVQVRDAGGAVAYAGHVPELVVKLHP